MPLRSPLRYQKYAKHHLNPYAGTYPTICAFDPFCHLKSHPIASLILRIEEHPKCRKKVIFFAWSDPQNLSSISSSLQKIYGVSRNFYTLCIVMIFSIYFFYFTNLSSSLNFFKKILNSLFHVSAHFTVL